MRKSLAGSGSPLFEKHSAPTMAPVSAPVTRAFYLADFLAISISLILRKLAVTSAEESY